MLTAVNGARDLHLGKLFAAAAAANGDPPVVSIGRTAENTVSTFNTIDNLPPLLENMVSRKHAQLAVRDGLQLVITDLGAVNKTYVNNVRVVAGVPMCLADGDVLSLGGRQAIRLPGGPERPNPWTWRLAHVADFLAAHAGSPRPAALLTGAGSAGGSVNQQVAPTQEVFRFSPLAGAAAVPPAVPPAPGCIPTAAGVREVYSFGTPAAPPDAGPFAAVAAADGSPAAGPAADERGGPESDDSGQLELAALEAFEAGAAQAGRQQGQGLAPAAADDVIDLTGLDDSPPPCRRQQQQQQHGRAVRAADGLQAEEVSLLSPCTGASPSKRRHQVPDAQRELQQMTKRAKPSPDGHLQPRAAEETAGISGAGAPAPAAGAGQQQPTARSAALQAHLMCCICQEVVVAAVAMVPCGHSFCGECLSAWLADKSAATADCPMCRTRATSAPIRSVTIDSVVGEVVGDLDEDEREALRERQASWERNREAIEAGLKAPWAQPQRHQQRGGSAARRGSRVRGGTAVLGGEDGGELGDNPYELGLLAHFLAGPGALFGGGVAPMFGGHIIASSPSSGGGGGHMGAPPPPLAPPRRQAFAAPAPPPPQPHAQPAVNSYRVEIVSLLLPNLGGGVHCSVQCSVHCSVQCSVHCSAAPVEAVACCRAALVAHLASSLRLPGYTEPPQ
eukprot:scaffold40.g5149.t1